MSLVMVLAGAVQAKPTAVGWATLVAFTLLCLWLATWEDRDRRRRASGADGDTDDR